MTIAMGLDQHTAQITAEWVDTVTGEVAGSRVAPAHRESVRRFRARFDDQELEMALETTTGWRFVVEELQRAGAVVHSPSRSGHGSRPTTTSATSPEGGRSASPTSPGEPQGPGLRRTA
jgi:hypothetical protein